MEDSKSHSIQATTAVNTGVMEKKQEDTQSSTFNTEKKRESINLKINSIFHPVKEEPMSKSEIKEKIKVEVTEEAIFQDEYLNVKISQENDFDVENVISIKILLLWIKIVGMYTYDIQ